MRAQKSTPKPASRRVKPTAPPTVEFRPRVKPTKQPYVTIAERREAKVQAAAPPTPVFEPVSTPLPIRITAEQQRLLAAKRERTGVPIQELVRRAIDHMFDTVKETEVPARRSI